MRKALDARDRRHSWLRSLRPLIVLALLAGLLPLATPAAAVGVIVVNSLADIATSPGAAGQDDGKCTLREAIQAANFDTSVNTGDCPAGNGADTITFSTSGTINLKVGGPLDDPDGMYINTEITITGPVIINGGSKTRVFRTTSNGILTLNNVTIQNGATEGAGGAILMYGGILRTFNTSFVNNYAETSGGAIDSTGQLSLLMTNFSGNRTLGDGGAIWTHSSYYSNKISLSNLAGNIAGGSGGAIYNDSHLTIEDSIISGNIITSTNSNDGGGAIYNFYGEEGLHVLRSAFNGNLAPDGAVGGAIANNVGATAAITDTSFNGNIVGDFNTASHGGAIFNWGDMRLVRTAFNANLASSQGNGAGLANAPRGALTIVNTSFFANAAGGNGGAIYNFNPNSSNVVATVVLTNTTIHGNSALGSGGGIWNHPDEVVRLKNTIVAGSLQGGNCSGPITSDGNNIDSGTTCGLQQDGDGDQENTDPKLDTPSYNGGAIASLFTQKLLDDSPAIDAAGDAACERWPVRNLDQRGEKRPNDGDGNGNDGCDIGAYEGGTAMPGYGSEPSFPGTIPFGNSQVGADPITTTLRIFETGQLPLTVISMTIQTGNANNFAILSPTSFVIANGGADRTVVLSCQASAAGERTSRLFIGTDDPKHALVFYDLTCNGYNQATAGYGSDPVAPGPLDLGSAVLGSQRLRSFVVSESGNATLTVSNPVITGPHSEDFAVTTDLSSFTIADDAPDKTIQVRCIPSDAGVRVAKLTLTTNDPQQQTVEYDLSCNGTAPRSALLAWGDSDFDVAGTDPSDPALAGADNLAVSADGKDIYVLARTDNAVSTFSDYRGGINFERKRTSAQYSNLTGPRAVEVSPDGAHAYIIGYGNGGSIHGSIGAYVRDMTTGILTGTTTNYDTTSNVYMDGPTDLAISPDGKYIFICAEIDDGVTVYRRNPTTGGVTLVHTFTNGTLSGLSGMLDPSGIAVSPDGKQVYVVSPTNNTIFVFNQNATSGMLSYAQKLTDLVGGVDGMDGAYDLAVSPDGGQVYVVATTDHALVVFSRNPADGKLSYHQDLENGLFVNYMSSPTGVAVSPDGEYVYVANGGADRLTVFRWDSEQQRLGVVESYDKGTNGVDGLGGARKVAVSPDGRRIYVTGMTDHSLTVMHRANPIPLLSSLSPSSVKAGGATFTLRVYGQNFVPSSTVRWGATSLPTTYINSTQLTVQVPASSVSAEGSVSISVVNPWPGGGTSINSKSFTIIPQDANPIPTALEVSPPSVTTGHGNLEITVDGTSFLPSSNIRWNGVGLATQYVSPSRLKAVVSEAEFNAPGTAAVAVFTPGPGGGISNPVTFTIVEMGGNPVPEINKLSPGMAVARGAASSSFILSLTGSNFTQDSVARWNGQNRTTVFRNSNNLEVIISAVDVAQVGQASITVFTPTPGGGNSNTKTFQVGYGVYLPLVEL